jgi:hypothetical protein
VLLLYISVEQSAWCHGTKRGFLTTLWIRLYKFLYLGRLVAAFSPRRPGFEHRSSHGKSVCDRVALGQTLLFRLPLNHSTNCSTIITIYHPEVVQEANEWPQQEWTWILSSLITSNVPPTDTNTLKYILAPPSVKFPKVVIAATCSARNLHPYLNPPSHLVNTASIIAIRTKEITSNRGLAS